MNAAAAIYYSCSCANTTDRNCVYNIISRVRAVMTFCFFFYIDKNKSYETRSVKIFTVFRELAPVIRKQTYETIQKRKVSACLTRIRGHGVLLVHSKHVFYGFFFAFFKVFYLCGNQIQSGVMKSIRGFG